MVFRHAIGTSLTFHLVMIYFRKNFSKNILDLVSGSYTGTLLFVIIKNYLIYLIFYFVNFFTLLNSIPKKFNIYILLVQIGEDRITTIKVKGNVYQLN